MHIFQYVVEGDFALNSGDVIGKSLHTNSTSKHPYYIDENGLQGALAWLSDIPSQLSGNFVPQTGTNYEIDYSTFTISYGNNQKAVFQNDSNFVIYDRNNTVMCAFGHYGTQMISPSLQARSENPYYDSTLEMRNTASGHGNAYAFISDDNHPNDYQQFGMLAKNIGNLVLLFRETIFHNILNGRLTVIKIL